MIEANQADIGRRVIWTPTGEEGVVAGQNAFFITVKFEDGREWFLLQTQLDWKDESLEKATAK
jgi:hypothetical protein